MRSKVLIFIDFLKEFFFDFFLLLEIFEDTKFALVNICFPMYLLLVFLLSLR